jgi:hypothetical protein
MHVSQELLDYLSMWADRWKFGCISVVLRGRGRLGIGLA